MPLYLPTSPLVRHHTERPIQKGELYNLDLNERIGFQFNPETIRWSRPIGWSESNWIGKPCMDYNYLGSGPTSFDVTVEYIADPTAPGMEFQSSTMVMPEKYVDVNQVIAIAEAWTEPGELTGKPSLLRIVLTRLFTAHMTRIDIDVRRSFWDMSARHAIITMSFTDSE